MYFAVALLDCGLWIYRIFDLVQERRGRRKGQIILCSPRVAFIPV